MSTVDLVASTVMNGVAALLNDPNRTTYTYTVQIPYLRIAMIELQEKYEKNGVSASQQTSAVIQVNAGVTTIQFNAVGSPALPTDLIDINQMWERPRGIDPFIPMVKKEYLPHYMEGSPINQLVNWIWQDQMVKFLPANADNDVKLDYIKTLFPDLVDENSLINVINATTLLQYRTAGLIAEFVERNKTSADSFNAYASLSLDDALGIAVKGKQAIQTRRRPFRQSFKNRTGGWR